MLKSRVKGMLYEESAHPIHKGGISMALFGRKGRDPKKKPEPNKKQHHRGDALGEDMEGFKDLYWP